MAESLHSVISVIWYVVLFRQDHTDRPISQQVEELHDYLALRRSFVLTIVLKPHVNISHKRIEL